MNTAPPVGTVVVDLTRTGLHDSTAGDDAVATVTAVLDDGDAVSLAYFDGTTDEFVGVLALGYTGDLGCRGKWGPCHYFAELDTARLRPDADVECSFCGVMITGKDYARSRGVVLMTKGVPPFTVMGLDKHGVYVRLGAAGTFAEMTAAVDAAGAPRLRRGRVLPPAPKAEGWVLHWNADIVAYSPGRPRTVGMDVSRRHMFS